MLSRGKWPRGCIAPQPHPSIQDDWVTGGRIYDAAAREAAVGVWGTESGFQRRWQVGPSSQIGGDSMAPDDAEIPLTRVWEVLVEPVGDPIERKGGVVRRRSEVDGCCRGRVGGGGEK
jgi:hypothetical protein